MSPPFAKDFVVGTSVRFLPVLMCFCISDAGQPALPVRNIFDGVGANLRGRLAKDRTTTQHRAARGAT